MKNLKPIIYYFISFILYSLVLFILSRGRIELTIKYYNDSYLYYNMLFASLYFHIKGNINYLILIILSLLALSISFTILEVVYPTILKNSIHLVDEDIVWDEDIFIYNEEIEERNITSFNNLEKAEYYLENEEFSTAFIYADTILEMDLGNKDAQRIINSAKEHLKSRGSVTDNPKYIETVKYKNMILQNRYLDAYYFCLEHVDGVIYDYDFSIKLSNCYTILTKNYYSINRMERVIKRAGYSDIKFYYTKGSIKLYSIEKLVEYNDEYYIKNLTFNGVTYPYIFIDKNGKVFSKGFNEEREEVFEYLSPEIPMDPSRLKLFSKELYILSNSSLGYNIKLFNIKNIGYFRENIVINSILERITSYFTLFIIFISTIYYGRDKSYLNILFIYLVSILSIKWYLKKIGLLLAFYGLGLSFIVVLLLYMVWLFLLIKRSNRQLALF